MADRTVHAYHPDGGEVVRYDREGKWYLEHRIGSLIPSRRITLAEAVRLADEFWHDGGSAMFGKPGGRAFDRELRKVYRA